MFTLVEVLLRRIPVVAVLANGGQISKHEVRPTAAACAPGRCSSYATSTHSQCSRSPPQILNAVRHGVAVVVIEGSGRLSDQVSRFVRHGMANPDWRPDVLAAEDPMLAEVLRDGRLHLFNVTDSWQDMQELLVKLLAGERAKLVRAVRVAVACCT